MTALEIKDDILFMLAQMKEKDNLEIVQQVMRVIVNNRGITKKSDWWNELTLAQQKRLQHMIELSKEENNLVSNEEVLRRTQKWAG